MRHNSAFKLYINSILDFPKPIFSRRSDSAPILK